MIVDQQRAIHDRTRITSGRHLASLTREEWEFLQAYRACSMAEQRLIYRALSGEIAATQSLAQRGCDNPTAFTLALRSSHDEAARDAG